MTESIEIGDYILRESGVVEYSDGTIIDLEKAGVLNIGIMLEDDRWVVSLITRAAILKLQKNITNDLQVIGFKFDEFKEAIVVHNILCLQLFKIEDMGEINES